MYTFKRYVTRIGLPFLAVAILVIVLRNIMVSRSEEMNVAATVRPEHQGLAQDEPIPWSELEKDAPYSTALKQDLVSKISFAASKLDAAMASLKTTQGASEEAVAALQERSEQTQQEIVQLEKANAENWQQRRRQAVAALRDYADAIEARLATGGKSGG